ncbi:hypothetical protein [Pedobacter rhizosphaerae]|uniref:hypothetical protein n=1 Tax=Pedobacter rhizosphaerae TaxID=390241 RepID=UPI001C316495|nr:hypothetical protein [Pedobacter rhizosphaerae]
MAVFVFATSIQSCSNANNKPIIKFSGDSSTIIIKNIDEASWFEARKAYQANPDANSLITVLIIPGDQDSLQTEREISGSFKLAGDSIQFTPDSTFLKGKTYLVENYVGVKFGSLGGLLKNNVKAQLQPQRQTLTR